MLAAALAGREVEAAPRIGVAGTRAAKMHERSELLLLLVRSRDAPAFQHGGDAPVEYAEVSSTAWLGITRMYRLLNQQSSTATLSRMQ